jgi:hypothetical protein
MLSIVPGKMSPLNLSFECDGRMSEDISIKQPEDLFRDARFRLHLVLNILKQFYTFKELEGLLNVPYQVLWRYLTLKSTPERSTVQKILETIKEERLVEQIKERFASGQYGVWQLLSNPGLLDLAALTVIERVGVKRFNVILSAPDPYSAALASAVSMRTRRRLCLSSNMRSGSRDIVEPYRTMESRYEVLAVPLECVGKKSQVLLVYAELDPFIVKPVRRLLTKTKSDLAAILSLRGKEGVGVQIPGDNIVFIL